MWQSQPATPNGLPLTSISRTSVRGSTRDSSNERRLHYVLANEVDEGGQALTCLHYLKVTGKDTLQEILRMHGIDRAALLH